MLLVEILLQSLAPELRAQQAAARFERYVPSDGLSNNAVTAVWQDRDGFVWFGTEDGLNRFDGHNFTVYQHDTGDAASLSDSWITAITGDASGTLWIGTRNRGLNRFDPETRTFTRYLYEVEDGKDGLLSGVIGALLLDRKGRLWIATGGGGLSRLDPSTGTFSHYLHVEGDEATLTSNVIWCLYEDREGNIWIGTWSDGLGRLDPETGIFQHYRADPGDPQALSSNRIRSIDEDEEGMLWIGTSGGGLNRLDPETGTFTHYLPRAGDPHSLSDRTVWSVRADSRGDLWVGTFGGGLNRFDRDTESFTRFLHDPSDPLSLPSNVVLSIFEDRSGLIWLATDQGVVKYNPASEYILQFRHDPANPASIGHDDVLAVSQSSRTPGAFWVGTNGGGLSRLDLETGRFTTFKHDPENPRSLSHDVVSAIWEEASGRVWVATLGGGLNAYDSGTASFTSFEHDPSDPNSLSHNVVLSLLLDRAGTLWAGTNGGGLNRLEREDGTFRHYLHRSSDPTSISDNAVSVLFESTDGALWAGTVDAGLNRLDPATGRFTRYQHRSGDPQSLSHNRIQALYEDAEGMLWVGTYGGLNRLDPATGRFTRFTVQDGFIGSIIYGIAGEPGGDLWIATNRGVSKYDPQSHRFTNYSLTGGARDTDFHFGAMARSPHGDILVGGANGLVVLRTRSLPQEAYHPRLVITAFRKFGALAEADLWGDRPIRLSYDDRHFSFEFALLDYANPAEHTFRYKLEGFDTDWQEVRGPVGQAFYSNLDRRTGSFVLLLQGVDSRGRSAEIRLPLTIVPPWWNTLWFKWASLLGTMLLLSVSAAYRHWSKQQELAERRRILSESREQERHFLARELHDMPLQNLYSVRHKLEVFARAIPLNGQADELGQAQHMLEQTAEELRRICGELRPPALSPFGLSKAIRAHLRTFEQAHPELIVTFELASDGQRLPESMRLALFRIYQGALSNIVRHAGARNVWVRFEVTDQEVVLEVQDDGKGFSVPKSWLELARQGHYGLLGIAEWADAAGGHLDVRSAPGEGALLQVRVPLQPQRTGFGRLSLRRPGGLRGRKA